MQLSDRIGEGGQLSRLRVLTDAGLSRLDVSELISEVLRRVCDLLDADVAAVMLLDAAGHVVPTAVETGVAALQQSPRSSATRDFSRSVIQSRTASSVVDVGKTDGQAPGHGLVRSSLGVPIFAAAEIVGVMYAGSQSLREFTPDDIELLQVAADRAGIADQIRVHRAERTAALALQNGLLPTQLPRLPALASAARYVPGHEFGVGGDWYDLLSLPSGWVGMIIGDVSGHGLASAVVMGRVRSALRAYTLVTDDPARALTLLDEKIYRFEAGTLTTALYAMISPDRSTIRVSSAGHLRPVLAVPGRPAQLVDMPVDAPLGIGRPGRTRSTTTVDLPPGALLLAYTDGLVERRDQIIDVGIKTLVDAVESINPDTVCSTVLTRFAATEPTDDVAVLALQRATAR